MVDVAMYFHNRNQVRFEEEIVKHLLHRYGLTKPWKLKLLQRHRRRERTPGLALADFYDVFERFPITLCLSDQQKTKAKNPFTHMLTKFDKLPVTQEYISLRDICGETDIPFGLLVKWPYLKCSVGAAVLHDLEIDLAAPGQRVCFVGSAGARPLILESLDGLLDAVDNFSAKSNEQPWFQLTEGKSDG